MGRDSAMVGDAMGFGRLDARLVCGLRLCHGLLRGGCGGREGFLFRDVLLDLFRLLVFFP